MNFGHRGPRDGEAADLRELGDDQLAEAVRTGTERAFGVLWDRHAGAGMAAARRMTAAFDPEDLVQEAYLRIWNALLNGRGPDGPFRPYLYQTLRNIAASWSHRTTDLPVDELPENVDPRDLSDDVVEGSVAMHAFRALPERWQAVLWYLEVEEMRPREAAPLLGLSASATAALAYRARKGLRRAWLQAHVNVGAVPPACRWTVERLGDYLRDNLSRDVHQKVRRHVAGCDDCTALVDELEDVSSRLRAGLLPLFLGVPALATQAGLGGTAAAGAAGGSSAEAGTGGVWHRAGRLSTRQVQGVVGGLAVTVVVGAAAWAGSVVLGGPPAAEGPGAAPVASSAPPSSDGSESSVAQEPTTVDPSPTAEPTPTEPESTEEAEQTEGTTAPNAEGATAPDAAPAEPDDTPDGGPTTGAADGPTPEPETPTTLPTPPAAPAPTPTPAVTSTPTPSPPTSTPTPSPSPSTSPSPSPSEDPADLPVLGSTTPRGTVAVFPRTSGQAPAGTLVTVTDEAGSLVNFLTVGDDGRWELTLDGLGTDAHGGLTVTQRAPRQEPVEDTIGPYVFDLPRILTPADGAVVRGTTPFDPAPDGGWLYTVRPVTLTGTDGMAVEALVDGRVSAGSPHELGEVGTLQVRGLSVGKHTLGLRAVEGADGENPRYGPTTTMTFTVVSPFGVASAVPAYP